jgi:hypothetical protein
MLFSPHRPHDVGKQPKISALYPQAVNFKEGDDNLIELPERRDRKGQDWTLWALGTDIPASEVRAKRFEHITMIRVLVNVKNSLDLPSPVSVHEVAAMHRYREAALPVYETSDPIGIELDTRQWGFLLIVRTGQIFTEHAKPYAEGVTWTSTAGYSDVPAYSEVYLRPSWNSTVIVTAAVYRGLGSGLRPKANPSP